MARYPKIQRTCPVKNSLAEYMDGDVCRLCTRRVFDLNAMTEIERQSFMNSCTDEVCVAYKLPRPRVVAAMAASAAMASMPVAAQETLIEVETDQSGYEVLYGNVDEYELCEIIVGGIKDFGNVEYVDTAEDLETPELPVTYEDG